jgi:purine-binding chemotaxis protein CheW
MTVQANQPGSVLVVTSGDHTCALPVHDVVETLRPLPVQAVVGMPAFVLGLSMVRGMPVPVVDLAALLEGRSARPGARRWLSVRVEARHVALAVDDVVGVRTLDDAAVRALPPLLRHAGDEGVVALGILDAQLLVLLGAARLLSDSTLQVGTPSAAAP